MNLVESNRCNDYILILKSLAVNLPILQSWGYIFPRLLRVVVEPGMQVRTIDILKNFPDSEYCKNWNSNFCFYILNATSREVISKVRSTLFERKAKKGLPIIITDNPIADDDEGCYFYVFMDERNYPIRYEVREIVPYPTDLDAIHNKLIELDDCEMMEEERILRAAVYFLEPYFFRRNELFRIDELLNTVDQMCIIDENARDTNDISEVFLKYLFEWQETTHFKEIHELGYGAEYDIDINEMVFHDDEYVYLTERLFKKIVEPMRGYAPLNSLKRCLRENGIIVAGKNSSMNTYTIKVSAYGNFQNRGRVRMIRLKRELLKLPGGLDLVDKCYLASEGGRVDVW